jgi:hypothetical protein
LHAPRKSAAPLIILANQFILLRSATGYLLSF